MASPSTKQLIYRGKVVNTHLVCNCKKHMDINAILLDQFQTIPEGDRQEVIRLAEANKMRMNWNYPDLEYLFRIWNTYVAPQDFQDIKCSHCRHHVVTRLRQMGKIYQEYGNKKHESPETTEG